MMKRQMTNWAVAAVALAAAATNVPTAGAADLYWQGGTGDLGSANYTSVDASTTPATVTPNVAPTSADYVYVGAGGSTTNAADLTLGRLRIGHNSTAAQPTAQPGDGSLLVSAGTLALGGTTTGGIDSGLLVGYNASGSLTITGGTVTAQFFGKIGYDTDSSDGASGTASVAVSGDGTLTISNRGLSIGEGMPGSLTLSDNATLKVFNGTTGNLNIGNTTTGTLTQTGGSTDVRNATFVGRNSTDGATLTVTGGKFASPGITVGDASATHSSATFGGTSVVTLSGAVNLGNGSATSDSTLTISGDAQVTGSAGLAVGNGSASTNTTATIKDNATVSLNNGMTVGLNAATNAVLNIGDNATVNLATSGASTGHFFLGRGTSTTTFNMTGGHLNIPNYFLAGTSQSGSTPVLATVNHSGGTITAGTNTAPTGTDTTVRVGFKLGDEGGNTNYNLSGTGTVVVANGLMIVGRQRSVAVMNQAGGSVTANGGVHIGQAETSTASLQTSTGTYNISGGTLAASVPLDSTVDALAIAPAGTGTLHVIGGDAVINVTGNMSVNNLPAEDPTPARVGTLAYTLEAGESLTEINVTGTATFAAGSILSLDLNGATPTQTSYDLLTAADIIDNGLSFTAPTGWNFQIVSGGNGEVLQAFTMAAAHNPGDTNNDGVVDLTDLNNVLNNFGVNGTGNPGDDNADNVVDLTDLNNVLNNFGVTYAAAALNVVPEPASLSLLGLGAAAVLGRRRRRA